MHAEEESPGVAEDTSESTKTDSQCTQGHAAVVLPVCIGIALAMSLGVALGWEVSGIFWVVSFGLILIGIGQALCLFTQAWRPDTGVS